jgi:hypothetical protein
MSSYYIDYDELNYYVANNNKIKLVVIRMNLRIINVNYNLVNLKLDPTWGR